MYFKGIPIRRDTTTGIKEANRFFWEIPKDCMRERTFDCETVKGSQSLHSIYSFSIADPTLLFVRKLSCFCAYCFDFDCTNCVNKSHVEGWELVKLKPGNLNHVRGHMLQCEVREDEQVPDEFEEVFDQDGMADFLRPGEILLYRLWKATLKELSFTYFNALSPSMKWRPHLLALGVQVTNKAILW